MGGRALKAELVNDIQIYYTHDDDAAIIADYLRRSAGITAREMQFSRNGVGDMHSAVDSNIDPQKKMIVFTGDGFNHDVTRDIVLALYRRRQEVGLPNFSFILIDAHEDSFNDWLDCRGYRSFVKDLYLDKKLAGVYVLAQALRPQEFPPDDLSLLPLKSELDSVFVEANDPMQLVEVDYSSPIPALPGPVYISVDFDVLDLNPDARNSINHLFPRTPVGYTLERLRYVLTALWNRYEVIGQDFCGFSRRKRQFSRELAAADVIEASLENISNTFKMTLEMCRTSEIPSGASGKIAQEEGK